MNNLPPIPQDLLEVFPGHLYPELMPEGVSLDFEMTKDNLFAVWYLPTDHQKLIMNFKWPSIDQDWCLADPSNALEQIQKFYGRMKVVAIVSFSELDQLKNRLEKPGFWRALSSKVYFVNENGERKWSREKKGTVLFEGKMSDIDEVISHGSTILESKKYHGLGDARGVQPGHPRDWIRFMSDAKGAMILREMRQEALGHDGSR